MHVKLNEQGWDEKVNLQCENLINQSTILGVF